MRWWFLMQEQLKDASETGKLKRPRPPHTNVVVRSLQQTGQDILQYIYLKCFSSLRILGVILIFNIVVSVSLSSPDG